MENNQINKNFETEILKKIIETKKLVEKQTVTFTNVLIKKISDQYNLDEEKLKKYFVKIFIVKVADEIDIMFNNYKDSEISFYKKQLTTVDQIFNHAKDKKTQRIYLDNILSNIIKKESLKEAFKSKDEDSSLDKSFNKFVDDIDSTLELSENKSQELRRISNQHYNIYKNDILMALNKMLNFNQELIINQIETEMDNKDVRNGKNSAIVKVERMIEKNSMKVMEEILTDIVSKHKNIAQKELNDCYKSMVDLIFDKLPEEYRNQKEILEVIVNTNINERLGKILNEETKTLTGVLKEQNDDKIQNEFYDEKRYKNVKEHEFKMEQIEEAYNSVLEEIRLAYDISEEDLQYKRLILIIKSESNSTKEAFDKLINNITTENKTFLGKVLSEMQKLSKQMVYDQIFSAPEQIEKKR